MSTTTVAAQFYSRIVRDPQMLANGYPLITQFLLESQQNRKNTLLALNDPNIPVLSLIINLYPQEIFTNSAIDDTEKDSTIDLLLDLIVTQLLKPQPQYRTKQVNLLFQFMLKIHNAQGFERWIGIYKQALTRLAQHQSAKFGYFLVNTLKQADDRVSVLSQELFPQLINFHLIQNSDEKLEIYYYMLKSLAFKVDTDPQAIQEYVSNHLETVLNEAVANIRHSPKSLKFSLKIITVLFGEYQVPCTPSILEQLEAIIECLIKQYINYLNIFAGVERENDLEDEQEPIQVALYQIMEIFTILMSNDQKLNLQRVLYLCLVSTFLGEKQYKNYMVYSDHYLMDIEDQGQSNVRNKSTFFIMELLQSSKYGKKSKLFLKEFITQVLFNLKNIHQNVTKFLKKYKLPQQLVKIPQIYTESVLRVLYSFTDDLMKNKLSEISIILGKEIKQSVPQSIDAILCVLILNKCLKTQTFDAKMEYLGFLKGIVEKYSHNIGMLIAIGRGVYQYCPNQQLFLTNQSCKGLPLLLVNSLNDYLLKDDSAQDEAAYLVLQFFVHLLKCESNGCPMQKIIPFDKQIMFLKKYLDTGMTSQIMKNLTYKLSNPQTLQAIYKQIQNGYAKDQNLSAIISKCIQNKTIILNQNQIITLCKKYSNKIDLVSNIVGAFVENNPIQNAQLLMFLCHTTKQEWLPGLLKQGKLLNIESKFVETVNRIINELQSPLELQNQLLIPYFAILNNTEAAINFLNNNNSFIPFFQKLYKYAKLFQGSHLKIITSHIFISLAQKIPDLTVKVVQLVKGYGKMDSSQWEDDEEELIQMGQEGEYNEGILDRMFSKMVNDKVEEALKNIFGQLAWDSQRLNERLNHLSHK